ncbi:S9 family peptidase [Maribacter polysiphoniae]|uniref:Prolyl oligopeptidase family protein n=1 Tax=Maribacter polysiphoniae TaxID=429344 RepID=A0A316DWJ7_9FLAO|nr:prolyl oligopeptidase family serine peptidase [Maribacter polysiphoniae]MBD1261703.1 S9 family peptidase [Maribacter polysiphoniae]PWK22491.1 prolyl oligopeptidase family protein [Maribacter polysiphoniae]
MKRLFPLFLLLISISVFAQKKALDHSDYAIWNTIKGATLAPDGGHVLYSLEKGEKDNFLKVKNSQGNTVFEHERSSKGMFTYDSDYVLFTIEAWKDSVIAMKSRKVKKKDLPKDSLGILNLKTNSETKIGNVKSYKLPEEWSGYVAYQLEEITKKKEKDDDGEEEKDSVPEKKDKKKKPKKVGKKTGYHVVLRNLETQKEDTLKFVTHFTFAKKGKWFAYTSTGVDKEADAGAYVIHLENGEKTNIHSAKKAKYNQLQFSESGKQLGFVVDTDTTKIQVRPNALYLWTEGKAMAEKLVDSESAPKGYLVSSDGEVSFSKDESKLFFGLRKPPIVKDTTLTDEEIVNVEVWTYDEPQLYTVQELQLKNDTIRSYQTVIHLKNKKLVPLATAEYPNSELGDEGNATYTLVGTTEPYELESQWKGYRENDYVIINTATGEIRMEVKKSPRMSLSPKAKYTFGYNAIDSTWFTYDIDSKAYTTLTKGKVFYDELNDSPKFPSPYGVAGFTENDASIILYDRYDLWEFDPKSGSGNRLTKGRETKTRYRYVQLDDEERFLNPKGKWLLSTFNEETKNSGYASYTPKTKKLVSLISGPFRYANVKKAKLSDRLLFTKESFEVFPDLHTCDMGFKKITALSNANPQQKDYNWGTIELVDFTSLDGKALKGLLVKPENFDPKKKYPMLVNFYERSTDNLYRHRAPKAERSSINYSFYTSRGYVIFNPDIEYRVGYPGESAYNCVIPGITSLIEKGFVDTNNIGVQGHSWGGYQIAYLVTKTDIFKAAESGAPVPNMISAYGGIRWWSGLSRQFQYEHTQSRIGGTPWEYPARYIENSPIFSIDKINTPLLIMHNDADGHVPWYQGIEFFVSLRRLGKPSWFLNYNGEPHWPLKLQNRKDFNIRMAQFFDYYLKGAPKPVWMQRGVPAMEKGVNQGLELIGAEE